MKATLRLLLAAIFAILCLPVAGLRMAAASSGVLHTRELVIQATVEGVDYAARTVTLRGPQADVVMVTCGQSVKNFSQIKVGDKVRVSYLEAVVIQMMKPENVSAPGSSTSVQVAPLGQKPAMATTKTEEDSVVIKSVDYVNRLVTIQMPDGANVIVDVDPNIANFSSIKPGDHIVVRRTRAIAVSVHE
jgi:Cu/Ag efflux protein CusF